MGLLYTMRKETIAITFLAVLYTIHFVGSIFFHWGLVLTPVVLITSVAVLLYFHQPKSILFWIWVIGVFQAGYILELLGISTGRIFGQYFYGNNLGLKLGDVPVIIGLNWLVLCYVSMQAVTLFFKNILKKPDVNPTIQIAFSAFFMVCIDVLIERVAPQLDFWYWKSSVVPLQNYTAWYIFAFAFMFVYHRLELPLHNKVAPWLYALQLLFYAGVNLLY